MANLEISVERVLWLQAARYLRQETNIRQALYTLKDSSELLWRVLSFSTNLKVMDSMLERDLTDPDLYGNLNQYIAMAGRTESILPLEDLIRPYQVNSTEPNPILGEVNRTWRMMRYYIAREAPGFAFVHSTPNPLKLFSGLLIEGYGLLMEYLSNVPSLRPVFIRAFEEVLINQDPNSPLLTDTLDWMVEERFRFSPGTRDKIDFYSNLRRGLTN